MINYQASIEGLVVALLEERDCSRVLRDQLSETSVQHEFHRHNSSLPTTEVTDDNLQNSIISMLFDTPILWMHETMIAQANHVINVFNEEKQTMRWLSGAITETIIKYELQVNDYIRKIKNSPDPHNIEQHFTGVNGTYDPTWILTKHKRSEYMNSTHYSQIVSLGVKLLNNVRSQDLINSLLTHTRIANKPGTNYKFTHNNVELLTHSMKEQVVQIIEGTRGKYCFDDTDEEIASLKAYNQIEAEGTALSRTLTSLSLTENFDQLKIT